MAKISRRTVSRKMKRTDKRKTTHHNKRKTVHRRNKRKGGAALDGAPVTYHLSGSWPSRMSLGQGADYFKYHEGQHGGGLAMGPYPAAVLSPGLPADLRGPAHIGGIDKAIADVRPLKDPNQAGGKRNKKNKTKRNKKNKTKRNKKDKRRTKKDKRNKRGKRKGGSLGYAPFPSSGMLLHSAKAYAQAGLNPEWKTDVAFTDAKIRDTQ
jgi:hypothetical protein